MLTITLGISYYYHPYFKGEEIEAQRWRNLPGVNGPVNGGDGNWAQAVGLQSHALNHLLCCPRNPHGVRMLVIRTVGWSRSRRTRRRSSYEYIHIWHLLSAYHQTGTALHAGYTWSHRTLTVLVNRYTLCSTSEEAEPSRCWVICQRSILYLNLGL